MNPALFLLQRRPLSLAVTLLLIGACASKTRDSAFIDAGPPALPVEEAGAIPFFGSDASRNDAALAGACQREIEFGPIDVSDPSCYTNESVANTQGTLKYPCATGGAVSVKFGAQTFTGTIAGSNVDLKNVELFIFPPEKDPMCRWESTQTIKGNLDAGPLVYEYSEKIATPGRCTSRPCQTTGKLAVTKVGAEVPVPR
jgi:hypothetical protein